METLLKELVSAGRGLRKNLGFAAIATMTIALGMIDALRASGRATISGSVA